MRIRKRKVPLPLSLLSPVPLSDPNLFSRSPVILHLHHDQPQPSDHFSSPPSDLITAANKQQDCKHKEQEEGDGEEKSCLEFQGGGGGGERVLSQLKSIHHNDDEVDDDDTSKQDEQQEAEAKLPVNNNGGGGGGRWSEGERVMPLKKRRPSSELAAASFMQEEKKEAVTNVGPNNNNNNNNVGNVSKKQKRGTTIMEGSRCSRVNGRGWRCCQPTLVGYSLCEHHLGKGRLRSMTTVRGRPATTKKTPQPPPQPPAKVKDKDKDYKDNTNNKRVNYKLGVVKARSLSSLLGQTTTMETPTETARTVTTGDRNVGSIC